MRWPWTPKPAPAAPVATPEPPAPRRISPQAVAASRRRDITDAAAAAFWKAAQPAPGVLPAGMAMDEAVPAAVTPQLNWAQTGMFLEGIGFEGFPYLSQLAQRAEFRRMVEILAKEMTRKWITLTTGDDADESRLAPLAEAMKTYRVRSLFREAFEHDGFFGRGQIYIETGADDPAVPLVAIDGKIGPDTALRFKVVEPYWSYPGFYDADDPLSEWFYKPRKWWVNGRTVDASRMVTIVSRELPDILKPVYQFAGLPLTQMAKPYVENWLTTRQAVNDLITNFSNMILKTDMSSILNEGGGDELVKRAQVYNNFRSNRGLHIVDKNEEDMVNVSAPLGSLDKLQAQAQEHMSSVSGIPLVVLLGITPSGLNATSEGEMQAFYAWIASLQEDVLRDPIQRVLDLLQLKTFGTIDPAVTFRFNPLWEESAEARALRRKTEADAAAVYIDRGVISADEERDRLKRDEESQYDLEGDAPEPPEDEADLEAEADENFGQDAAWSEADHPRREDGKFGSGGGANSSSKKAKAFAASPTVWTSRGSNIEYVNNQLAAVESSGVRAQQEAMEEALISNAHEYFTMRSLDPSELKTPQKSISREQVLNVAEKGNVNAESNGEWPLVIKGPDGFVVVDGNHRANAAILRDEPLRAQVFDYDAWKRDQEAKKAAPAKVDRAEIDALLAELQDDGR